MEKDPVPCGWYHPWDGGLGFYKNGGWASCWKQASKQHASMASVSTASRFLPCWSSYPNFLLWWTMMWKFKLNRPFPPEVAFGHGYFITAIVILAKTETEVETRSHHQEKIQRHEHREVGRIKCTQMITGQPENCGPYNLEARKMYWGSGINRKEERKEETTGESRKGIWVQRCSCSGVSLYSSEAPE